MSDSRADRSGTGPQGREPEPSLRDLIEGAVRKIVTAVVLAGALIALAIYSRPAPPRYVAAAADGRIVRIDTRTGTMIACDGERCFTILRRGQRLDRDPEERLLPAPAPAPAPAAATPAGNDAGAR